MKNTVLRKLAAAFTAGALTLSLAACGQGQNRQITTEAQASTDQDATEKTKIVAATTGTGPSPYIFQGDDGNLDGYDIEVLKEIFSRLPQYELEFQTTEFASIFTGIDAGYYQIGVNHMGYNRERGEKYLFSDVYSVDSYGILVRDDNTDIKTLDDLPGHTTQENPTNNNASIYQAYNEKHPDAKIEVSYVEDNSNTPIGVSDGRFDFSFFSKTTLQSQIKEYGLDNLKIIDVPVEDSTAFTGQLSGNFFLISKEYPKLAEEMNTAFEAALEEGKILEISKKYLGEDADNHSILNQDYIEYARDYITKDLESTN